MRLYLIRHAKAADAPSDRDRPLSAEGTDHAARLAHRLHQLGVRWELIVASPLTRARETAEILRAAGLAPLTQEATELAPGGELAAWLPFLAAWRDAGHGDLAAVGHLPSLVDWAEQLVFGEARGGVVLKPAGLVALEVPGEGSLVGRCALFWLTSPRLLA
jgi:phosphohistidine phosphatase